MSGATCDCKGCSDKTLRVSLEERGKPYVLAVRGNEKLTMGDFDTYTAEQLAADLVPHEWQSLPTGVGSKGPRLYDWALWGANTDPKGLEH